MKMLKKFKEIFFLLKIHHWLKNLVIYLPMLASHSIDIRLLKSSFFYFFILCILSSIIYLINNTYDYKIDKINKKLKYTIKNFNKNYLISLLCYLVLLFLIQSDKNVLTIAIIYFILSISYNILLKKIKYLDIFSIAVFHMIRIYYGSIIFEIELSSLFTIFFSSIFLMIGANKRLNEIRLKYINRPYKLKDIKYLKIFQNLFAIISLLIFILFIFNINESQLFKNSLFLYINFIILIFIILNYLYFSKNDYQDVVIFFIRDRVNQILILVFLLLYYLNSNFFYN